MIYRFHIGRWRFTFSMAPTENVIGVNSTLPDGKHILMWDFDDTEYEHVLYILRLIQKAWKLSNIYILETKPQSNYMAYCFKKIAWKTAVRIIAATPSIDLPFLKYALLRGHFTLRVSPKSGRKPKLIKILHSPISEDAAIPELKSWVKYQTIPDGTETKIHDIKVV